MELITTISTMTGWASGTRSSEKTIGFVPTMGALHEGHLELVRASVKECDATVVSVFVNPTQFGPGEDLNSYPRDLERDKKLLSKAGSSVLFTTEANDMYNRGFETWVSLERLPDHLCGLDRPGHFRGVTTVVAKLFNIVTPHKAYFGWKDAQQAFIIKKMVRDLNFGIEIRVLPIVRDRDGLALSSRNAYLSKEERQKALLIPGAVKEALARYRAGERDGRKLLDDLRARFDEEDGVEADYISLVKTDDLEETLELGPETMLALAVRIGKTRLIDNCRFTEEIS